MSTDPSDADAPATHAQPAAAGVSSAIASRALRGGLVTATGTVGGFVIRLASNAFFARQMTPDEFGVWGFAAVWATLAGLPYAMSLPTAMLQLPPGTRHLFGTIRAMSLKLVALVLAASAVAALVIGLVQGPAVAHCFIGLALGQAVSAIGYVYDGALQRSMRYHVVAAARFAGVVGGLVVAIPFALATPGPFVLVLRDALPPLLSLAIVVIYLRRHKEHPELALETGHDPDTAQAARRLGAGLLANRLVEALVNRLDSLLVGLAFGERALGNFDQARYLAGLPNAVTGTFTHSVALRTFAAVRDDPTRLTRALTLLQWLTARVTLAGTCLCLVAPELIVRLLFGPGWDLSADMLRTFAPWLALVPLVVNQQVFLTAIGTLAPVRQALLLNACALPLGLAVALWLEAPALAPLGNTLGYLVMFIALAWMTRTSTVEGSPGPIRLTPRWMVAPLGAVGGGVAVGAAVQASLGPDANSLPTGALAALAALAAYVCALFLLEGRALVAELRYLLQAARRRPR